MDNEIAAIDEIIKMTSQSEKSKITGLGARLRSARETMHLTQKEAAARLYLNPKIIEVIENEAFFNGPPMTFMRGYLRSYARLLNLPENDIKAAVDALELTISPTTPTVPILQVNPSYRGDRYISWITYLIVLTLIVLVILWWSSHSKYATSDAPIATTAAHTNNAPTVTDAPITTPAAVDSATNTNPAVPTSAEATINTTITPEPHNSSVVITSPIATPIPPPAMMPPVASSPETNNSTAPAAAEAPLTTTPTASALITLPSNDSTVNSALETTPKEKPKRKHRRHQYRPIENIEIPEPE